MKYELLTASGERVEWSGADGTDAAQRCANATGHAIVAWRAPRFVVAVVHPSQIIG
jgi:hypothetical protein